MAALLTAAAAGADGWSTNAWPSWSWPRSGERHAWDAWGSVTERCDVSGYAIYPDAPSFWRSQRANLTDDKTTLGNLGGRFLQRSTNSPADYSDYMNAASPKGSFPTYAAWTALSSVVRAPTNYLDYTPWRALCGAGGYTNDATVGHPHGWSVGVTNDLPAGRTNWYTTDYGWAPWTGIVDELTRTATNVTVVRREWASLSLITYTNYPDPDGILAQTNVADYAGTAYDLPVDRARELWVDGVAMMAAFWAAPPWKTTSPAGGPWTEAYWWVDSSTNSPAWQPAESWQWEMWARAERLTISNTAATLLQTQYSWSAHCYVEVDEPDAEWHRQAPFYVTSTNSGDWARLTNEFTSGGGAVLGTAGPDLGAVVAHFPTGAPTVSVNGDAADFAGQGIVGGAGKAKAAVDWGVTNGLRYR